MTICTRKIVIDRHPNILVNRDYTPLMAQNNLLDFDHLYHFKGGRVIKEINQRSVIQITLMHQHQPKKFFIKRHVAAMPEFEAICGNSLQRRSLSPGLAEFENICEFRKHRLATVTPVAAGQRYVGGLRYESFLITEDFAPYISLEELILSHPERLRGPEGIDRKRRIIEAVGRLARKMHDSGFNHRDFNATHILIDPGNADRDHYLGMFDLQRIDRKKWLQPKWFIKIMAELGYTMPSPVFSEDDRRRLYQTYLGNTSKRWFDPLLHILIQSKIRKIGRHTEKIKRRRKLVDKDVHDRSEKGETDSTSCQ